MTRPLLLLLSLILAACRPWSPAAHDTAAGLDSECTKRIGLPARTGITSGNWDDRRVVLTAMIAADCSRRFVAHEVAARGDTLTISYVDLSDHAVRYKCMCGHALAVQTAVPERNYVFRLEERRIPGTPSD